MVLDWLVTELKTDPLNWNYVGMSTWTTEETLNDVTRKRPVAVHTLSDMDLLAALASGLAELGQIGALQQWIIGLVAQVTQRHTIDPAAPAFQAMVGGLFPAAQFPATNAAFLALGQRTGSRAEELAGAGTVVSVDEVQAAREAAGLV